MSTTLSETFGGLGGGSFSEIAPQGTYIVGFILRANGNGGQFLEYIQPIYSNGNNGIGHGGTGGSTKSWSLDTGAVLTEIKIWSGKYIDAIQFISDNRSDSSKNVTKSLKFGGSGGKLTELKIEKGRELIGISGKCGSWIDSLQFTFSAGPSSPIDPLMGIEMSKFYHNRTHSDITVLINDKKFELHSLILNQNPILWDLLKIKKSLVVEDLKYFEMYLEYLYSGTIRIDEHTFNGMIKVCDTFSDNDLITSCYDYLIKTQCSTENVFQLLIDAKNGMYGKRSSELITKCNVVINQDVEQCLNAKKFLELPLDIAVQVLSSDISTHEIVIYETAVKYSKAYVKSHSGVEYNEIFKSFIPSIRLPLLEEDELLTIIKPSNAFPFEKYLEALEYKIAPEDCEIVGKSEYKTRGGQKGFIFVPCNSTNFTLSNKNYTVEKTGGGNDWNFCQVHGKTPFGKGVTYFEYVIDTTNSDKSGFAVGITPWPGNGMTSVSNDHVCGLGGSNYGTVQGGTLTASKKGSVIGILVEPNKSKVSWFLDGKSTGLTFNMVNGVQYCACVHLYYVGNKVTLKFPTKIPKY